MVDSDPLSGSMDPLTATAPWMNSCATSVRLLRLRLPVGNLPAQSAGDSAESTNGRTLLAGTAERE